MQTGIGPHRGEDTLELYARGQLSSDLVPELEEHILMCVTCQTQLGEIDAFQSVAAQAGDQLRRETIVYRVTDSWRGLLSIPKPIWVGMLATILLTVTIFTYRATDERAAIEIPLHADRGRAQQPRSKATHGSLLLRIDTTEFPQSQSFWIQVADSAGRQLLLKSMPSESLLTLPIRLGRGHYWVRLLSPARRAEDKHLLREFALDLE